MSELAELLASSPTWLIGTCLLVGLLVGSFLNVVIYRVPVMLERQWREQCMELAAGEVAATPEATTVPAIAPFNLVVPRSACPGCKAPITAIQNVPVLSYLFLKGRCANCGVRISARYPAIEALTGLLSAAVAYKFGFGLPLLAALIMTWFLVALTFIDVDHQLLPDSLTLPLLWIGLLFSLWAPLGEGVPVVPVDPRSSIVGAIAGYLSLWSVYHLFRLLTGKEGMGYGDFKLFAALGAWLGWKMLVPIIMIAAVVGAVVGIAMLALRGQSRSTPIAFGPFLATAGWLMLMFGQELVTGYLGMFSAAVGFATISMSTRAFRVGLTGGIASGKSTASKFFGALGVPIIDTDQVARDVVEPGQPPLERLVERFGQSILTPEGHLDRPALRNIVFSDPKARADLEALTHPAIGAAVEARSAIAGGPYQILVLPLLVEKSLGAQLDRVLVVDCDEDLQMQRLQARDGSTPEQARAILNAQASRAARLKAAHDIIKNDGDMSAVRDQVAELHTRYLELARQARP